MLPAWVSINTVCHLNLVTPTNLILCEEKSQCGSLEQKTKLDGLGAIDITPQSKTLHRTALLKDHWLA